MTIDLTKHLEAESDCIVAADLAAGPKTILITNVIESKGQNGKKKIEIHYEGMEGKPYKPCKSMLRLICELWRTSDGSNFVGRGLTLYREQKCLWKGEETPGVRICGMSHIDKDYTVLVQEKRGKATSYVIKPITPWPPEVVDARLQQTLESIAKASEDKLINARTTLETRIKDGLLTPEQSQAIQRAIDARAAELSQTEPK